MMAVVAPTACFFTSFVPSTVFMSLRRSLCPFSRRSLRPLISGLRQRRRPHAIAVRREDRVRDSRQNRRQCRLAEARRVVVRGDEESLDRFRRLTQADRLVLIEVLL